jgi:hypothetical protein
MSAMINMMRYAQWDGKRGKGRTPVQEAGSISLMK